MTFRPLDAKIFHITDVENLEGIIESGLLADSVMVERGDHTVIGYGHIKRRRLEEIQIDCCDSRYVGEFVPFYFCPRSPMLYTINLGNTGRPRGCQSDIVHLVSTVGTGVPTDRDWAFSDGNAGALHSSFYSDVDRLAELDWTAINARYWMDKSHQKQAEFLVADHFPWSRIQFIGCHNTRTAQRVEEILRNTPHQPEVRVKNDWYY